MNNVSYGMVMLMCVVVMTYEIVECIRGADRSARWRGFVIMMITMDTAFISDTVYGFFSPQLGAGFVSYFLNHVFNLALVLGAYFWFLYSESGQDMKYIESRRNRLLLLLPFVACWILNILGLTFYIDESGYHRGPMYYAEIAIIYGMLIFTGVKALFKMHQRKNYQKRDEYLAAAYFLITPLISAVLQVLMNADVPALSMGITIACIMIVQSHQKTLITKDPLTGLNNRGKLVSVMARKMAGHTKPLYLLMIDADGFKGINDNYGHTEGDAALVQIAAALRMSVPQGFTTARYGGDEFAIVGETEEKEDIEAVCKKIHTTLDEINAKNGKDWNARVSIGYTEYRESMESIPDFIEAADAELYRVKQTKRTVRTR